MKNCLKVHVTPVSNEFIDRYMVPANGEYVKVYLYLLRHEGEFCAQAAIADALDCTEADIRRALAYWERQGVLAAGEEAAAGEGPGRTDAGEGPGRRDAEGRPARTDAGEGPGRRAAEGRPACTDAGEGPGRRAAEGRPACTDAGERPGRRNAEGRPACTDAGEGLSRRDAGDSGVNGAEGQDEAEGNAHRDAGELPDPAEGGAKRMERLSGDEDFSTLLYVAQQYLGKTFTSLECEKFAYFYDGLRMSGELLEYLAEYCAQIGKTGIRYIEKVALNWYQTGITSKTQAEDYTLRFSKNMSSVMKAFGLTGRNPGTSEQELLKKWFYTYGFERQLVVEACDRTLKATQTPSFQYADKILSDWKNNGVKTLHDVEEMDKNRRSAKAQPREKEKGGAQPRRAAANRFNNFEGRSYDYESIVWDEIRKKQKGGNDSGA